MFLSTVLRSCTVHLLLNYQNSRQKNCARDGGNGDAMDAANALEGMKFLCSAILTETNIVDWDQVLGQCSKFPHVEAKRNLNRINAIRGGMIGYRLRQLYYNGVA